MISRYVIYVDNSGSILGMQPEVRRVFRQIVGKIPRGGIIDVVAFDDRLYNLGSFTVQALKALIKTGGWKMPGGAGSLIDEVVKDFKRRESYVRRGYLITDGVMDQTGVWVQAEQRLDIWIVRWFVKESSWFERFLDFLLLREPYHGRS
jgi:hypothetical protein